MTLTALTLADNNFTVGDLDTTNQVAMCPAYQKVYFADGRPYDSDITKSGYHKLDMINTRLVGTFTAAQKDAFTTATTGYTAITNTTWETQTFTATSDYLMNSVRLKLHISGNPGQVTISIYNVDPITTMPTGSPLVTATLGSWHSSGITTDPAGAIVVIPFLTALPITSGTVYAIVVRSQFHGLRWHKVSAGGYDTGTAGHSTNSGAAWTVDTSDFYFETWATNAFIRGEVVSQDQGGGHIVTGIFDETTTVGSDTWTLIFRTTPLQFVITTPIVGSISGTSLIPTAVAAPPHWLNWTLVQGQFPDGGSDILALAFGRIFMNAKKQPNQWYATRASDIDLESGTLDGRLDMLMEQADLSSPCSSQNTKAGLVGDAIISISAYKDFYVVFGCSRSVWVLIADPLNGGILREVTNYQTGIFSPTSSCWDDKGNFYFVGTDGIYRLDPSAIVSAQPPVNLTKLRVPQLVPDLALNRGTDRVVMAFDKKNYGILISASMQDGSWAGNYWIDLRFKMSVSRVDSSTVDANGIFPDVYPTGLIPASLLYLDAKDAAERQLLLGGYDGYVRKYDPTAKSDDGGTAIVSNVVFGPITDKSRSRGLSTISNISGVIDPNSDDLEVRLYAAQTAKELLNNMAAGVAPDVKREFEQSSLLPTIRQRVTGGAFAVAVGNEEAGETWSLEKITANIDPAGRIK
jgi:hypothetical protein